jgi:PAS domain S-box-containing protein
MFVYDLETLGYLAVNDAAVHQYGYSRDEFSRMTLRDLCLPEEVPALLKMLSSTRPVFERRGVWRHRRKDGSVIDVEITAHGLQFGGRDASIVAALDVTDRKQRERDAQMLTNEISHRIKNNLQLIVHLIAFEARSMAQPYVQGYNAMQARIGAIAQLYDLISQSSHGQTVAVDAYLREIAKTMSASLLGNNSGIKIEVKAEALYIDANRAVPFGLLVNELTTNAIKQAAEFGIVAGGQKLAALLLFINDVHSLGLKTAQGLSFTESFYWDMNDQTRAWSKKFSAQTKTGAMPSMTQAGLYSGVLHYLKALEAMGGNPHDGAKVVAKMKELPTDDVLFGKGTIRADGRKMLPAYLFEVKKPEESKYPWDYYKLVATIPAEEAARPLSESECPLIKK